MDLQLGDWKASFNGYEVVLKIESVDSHGQVAGHIGTAAEVVGFWDDSARKLILSLRPLKTGDPAVLFTGYLFSTPPSRELGQDVQWTIAGYFEIAERAQLMNFPVDPPAMRRHVFGWVATATTVQ